MKQTVNKADTQEADLKGLPGKFLRPVKVTILGAGSFFTTQLVNDILEIPGNQGGVIGLVDIDTKRLDTIKKFIELLAGRKGGAKWVIEASRDRVEILKGSDYVINCIEVSGLQCVQLDHEIPAEFGVHQCIGDTIGPAGLFKALRTVPVWLEILRDVERFCPEAIVLNYTNPMNMMCLAAGRTSPLQVVGLCHSVQSTSHFLASEIYADVPYDELEWECAGINHLAWFVTLKHRGKDLYPMLKRRARKIIDETPTDPTDECDLVRKDMMLHFGAFITESSGHLSEYLPYYRKRADTLKRYCRSSHSYAKFWPVKRLAQDAERKAMLSGKMDIALRRSWEYASWIIEAREKDSPFSIHGNVMNGVGGTSGLITNLPGDACVEVECLVGRKGVKPLRFGALPRQMAAVCSSNISMFDLGAQAAIELSRDTAIHALLLDPLTAAVCSPAEITDMALKMFRAQKRYLPAYR